MEEEIPGNGSNVAYRHINLENVAGRNDWRRKNWGEEWPSIIETGFNGGGLCSFSWLSIYEEYLGIFHPATKLLKE